MSQRQGQNERQSPGTKSGRNTFIDGSAHAWNGYIHVMNESEACKCLNIRPFQFFLVAFFRYIVFTIPLEIFRYLIRAQIPFYFIYDAVDCV